MRIKIIHVLHAVGGVDVSLRLILSNINSNIFQSVVIHGKIDTTQPFLDSQGRPVKNYTTEIIRSINPFRDVWAVYKTYRIIKKEKPHLIHAHSAKGGVIGKIVGYLTNTPVLHTPQAYSYLSTQNTLKRKIYLTVEKFLSKFNNKIVASSASERDRAINEVGYNTNRVLVFDNAINPIKGIKDLGIEKTWPDNYICSVGRPSFQKNIEMMIEVIHKVKKERADIHLVLMGVGYHSPNLTSVKEKIKKYNLEENITLLEWTAREDVFNIIKNARFYISTARYEGLPYSIIESLALQKTCIVTDADGNRDLIIDNHNGYVIFDKNVEQFKNRIIELLENNNLRNQFENESFSRFNREFNINNTISKLEEIYKTQSKE